MNSRLSSLVAVFTFVGAQVIASAAPPTQSEPAPASPASAREEPAIPQVVDGWELHVLDVTKSVIFQLPDGRRQTVEVPIFVYLPVKGEGASTADSLKDVASNIKELIAKGEPVTAQELRILLSTIEVAAREARRSEQSKPPFRR